MTKSAPLTWLSALGFLLAAMVTTPAGKALAEDHAGPPGWMPSAVAGFNRQRERPAAHAARQSGLVETRIQSTRAVGLRGRNIDDTMLRLRFEGGEADRSAVLDTRQFRGPAKLRERRRFATWFGGDVVLDSRRMDDPRQSSVHTNGLVMGIDARINERLLVGNATGIAFDRSAVGAQGMLTTRTISDTLYGSFATGQNSYLDAVAGVAASDFSGDYGTPGAVSDRDGREAFASARLSHRIERGDVALRPYGRGRVAATTLSGAQGEGRNLLEESQTVNSAQLSVGLDAQAVARTDWGTLRPSANVEFSRTARKVSSSALHAFDEDYVDIHEVDGARNSSGRVSVRSGLDWSIDERTSLKGEYRMSTGTDSFAPVQAVSGSFRVKF